MSDADRAANPRGSITSADPRCALTDGGIPENMQRAQRCSPIRLLGEVGAVTPEAAASTRGLRHFCCRLKVVLIPPGPEDKSITINYKRRESRMEWTARPAEALQLLPRILEPLTSGTNAPHLVLAVWAPTPFA
jgi:hypothetical protein